MNVRLLTAVASLVLVCAAPAASQEQPTLGMELNGLDATERGCRLTFVAENQLGADIGRAAYEVALFGKDGLVKRLTVLDFKALPDGETKVRQFELPEVDCAGLGRILVNGASACEAPKADICMEALATSARGDVAFGK